MSSVVRGGCRDVVEASFDLMLGIDQASTRYDDTTELWSPWPLEWSLVTTGAEFGL